MFFIYGDETIEDPIVIDNNDIPILNLDDISDDDSDDDDFNDNDFDDLDYFDHLEDIDEGEFANIPTDEINISDDDDDDDENQPPHIDEVELIQDINLLNLGLLLQQGFHQHPIEPPVPPLMRLPVYLNDDIVDICGYRRIRCPPFGQRQSQYRVLRYPTNIDEWDP
jgi:hypothetical protein